jgi:hypothetical protein
VVLIILYLTAHRPEMYMYIEEVHVDGHLNALGIQILRFKDLVYNNDFSVRYRCDIVWFSYALALWHSKEIEYESHEEHRDDGKKI